MWIELHDGARDHPKILKVARDLEIPRAHALGLICSLWTWTLRMAPDGNLSSFDTDDIELAAGWEGKPGAFMESIVERKLLDKIPGGYACHDWQDYSGSLKAAERKRRERAMSVTRQSRDSHATVVGLSRDVTQNDRPTDRQTEELLKRERQLLHGSKSSDPDSGNWLDNEDTVL